MRQERAFIAICYRFRNYPLILLQNLKSSMCQWENCRRDRLGPRLQNNSLTRDVSSHDSYKPIQTGSLSSDTGKRCDIQDNISQVPNTL